MLEIGKLNRLKVLLRNTTGAYLDGGEAGRILLPAPYVPDLCEPGEVLEVFVYFDTNGHLIATTLVPLAQVDEFAWLKVVAINAVGAFLDWGLPKDLLVPYSEQRYPLEIGRYCLVKVLYDQAKGIAATTFIEEYLSYEVFYLQEGRAVSLLIADKTDAGFKAIVNNAYWGLLYRNEVFQPLKKGQKIGGYVKRIRDDRRIDLSLYPLGYAKVDGVAGQILQTLRQSGGFLPISDKSSPEAIYAQFGVSKKVYKQAIGGLYKQRLITIEEQGIQLVKDL